nr:MAG TPA: hypothetical protein [Caudoviricetes sp.]
MRGYVLSIYRALEVFTFHRVHLRDTVQRRTRNLPDTATFLITL